MEAVKLLAETKSKSTQKKIMKQLKKIKKTDLEKKYGVAQLFSWACYYGNFEAAKYLLKKGSNPNQISFKGYTPFKWACECQSIEIVEYMLRKYPPDLLIVNEYDENDFFYLFDNYLGVEIIERCISLVGPEKFRDVCQHISKRGHTLMSKSLQSIRNKNISQEDAEREIMSKIELLLSYGADPLVILDIQDNNLNLMDFINNNSLINKYRELSEKLIDFFINLGVTGEIEGKDSTLLYQYCYRGNISVVEKLIRLGYDVNNSYNSTTALIVSIKNENFEVARLLMESPNIDLKKLDSNGFDAIFYAMNTDFTEFILELLEKVDIKKTYKNEVENHDINIPQNFNLLHVACYRKNIPIILYLLENGFKLEDKGSCSMSPLEILAIRDPDNNLLKFLNQSPTKFEKYAKNKKSGKVFEQEECAICLEDLEDDITSLKCGHVFHTNCILNVLAQQGKCPICRADIVINHKVNKLLDKAVMKSLSRTKKRPVSRVKSLSIKRSRNSSNNSSIRSRTKNSLNSRGKIKSAKLRSV